MSSVGVRGEWRQRIPHASRRRKQISSLTVGLLLVGLLAVLFLWGTLRAPRELPVHVAASMQGGYPGRTQEGTARVDAGGYSQGGRAGPGRGGRRANPDKTSRAQRP